MKKQNEETKTTIIMDTKSIAFNPSHDLWYTVDAKGNVIDFFTYSDFHDYVKQLIAEKLSRGYTVVAVESKYRIEITFVAHNKDKVVEVFQMAEK